MATEMTPEQAEQHEQKIAEKREEIGWMAESFGHARGCECPDCIVRDRIRAVLESQLDELTRGFKSDAAARVERGEG